MTTILSDAELLARLIAFDSTSANSNLPVADFIYDYLEGESSEILRSPYPEDGKTNLVIRIKPAKEPPNDHAGLILSGHMDVVPAKEPEWTTDPFQLAESDDAFLGRGACDMKGFIALAVNQARRAMDRHLAAPLVLILTCDEELGTRGAQHLANAWTAPIPLPKNAIIGEPTSLEVVRMHKGQLSMRLVFKGKTAHTGYPDLGINAIDPAAKAIIALNQLGRQLREEPSPYGEHFPETPFVALSVTVIQGGTATNIVPDRCEVSFGIRTMPGMSDEPFIQRVRETLAAANDLGDHELEIVGYSPPLLTEEDAPINRYLCSLVGQSRTVGKSYASDAGPLSQLGLDCVLFGPGNIEVAHKPNEFLPKSEFVRAGELLDEIVQEFCEQ